MTTTVSLIGNACREPEMKFLPSGIALCEFGVAINSRRKEGDKWVDGDPEFYDITCWRELADNVAESISKGQRVIILGKLNFRSWEDKDSGQKRSKISVTAEAVGPDLRWATAQVTRTERSSGDGGYQQAPPPRDDEDPFRVDAGEWDPRAGYGSFPERLLG